MKDGMKSEKIKLRAFLVPAAVLTLSAALTVAILRYAAVAGHGGGFFSMPSLLIAGLCYLCVVLAVLYFSFKRYDRKVSSLADTDRLTSGINYEKFLKDAQAMIDAEPEKNFAVFYGDIRNFKYVNDTFGYDVGDRLLMYISERLRETIGEKGLFARISADNYAAIVSYSDKSEFVEPIYAIMDDVCWFEDISKAHYKPEIYVGVYCSEGQSAPVNADTGEKEEKAGRVLSISEMIDRANMAQKSVKGSTEYHIAFYTEEIRERLTAEKELERRMESALAKGEFKVYYQPKYEVDSGEIVGAEALVRWDSPEAGFMSPAKFIPLFEQNGFIINLDQFVFETACRNMREWIDQGIKVVPVSVNVSRLQFYRIDFIKRYTKIKEKYDIPDGLLELEFTESIVFENLEILRKIVLALKKAGFSCSIDDFGSGYSSLNILKDLPMDTLKLDKLFFKESDDIERDKALVSSVIVMSRALHMQTVAEGIENWAQVVFLKKIGCDIIQGFVYSEPITCSRYVQLLHGNRSKEIPSEFKKSGQASEELSVKDAGGRLKSAVTLLPGLLIEVDFDSDAYCFVNPEILDEYEDESIARSGTGYDNLLKLIIDKYIHPDDRQTVRARCNSVSVMSSFYQNAKKIVTETRIFSKLANEYEWAKIIISKIEQQVKGEGCPAYVYFEPASLVSSVSEKQAIISGTVKEALMSVCSMIYEVNVTKGNYKNIYCNLDDVGDQPDSGELTWIRECYLKKMIRDEDQRRILDLTNIARLNDFFTKGGKKQISASMRALVKGKEKEVRMTIVPAPKTKGDRDTRYFVICDAKDNKDRLDYTQMELDNILDRTMRSFCDLIISIDIDNNTYESFNSKYIITNLFGSKRYTDLIAEFLAKIVHPDDSEHLEKLLLIDNIRHDIGDGRDTVLNTVSYRIRKYGEDGYIFSRLVRIAYSDEGKDYCTLFINGVNSAENGSLFGKSPYKQMKS